jgi:hypothetical protein
MIWNPMNKKCQIIIIQFQINRKIRTVYLFGENMMSGMIIKWIFYSEWSKKKWININSNEDSFSKELIEKLVFNIIWFENIFLFFSNQEEGFSTPENREIMIYKNEHFRSYFISMHLEKKTTGILLNTM